MYGMRSAIKVLQEKQYNIKAIIVKALKNFDKSLFKNFKNFDKSS